MGEAGSWSVEWETGAPRERLAAVLDALARDAAPPGSELVKHSPARRVYRLPPPGAFPGEGGPGVYVKCYPAPGRASWRAPAAREFSNLRRLAEAGFPVVGPLAYARLPGRLEVLATREEAGARPLKERLATAASQPGLLDALAALVHRLHAAGFWHRDLHTGNLLVGPAGTLVLVDVQKLRKLPFAVPLALRLRDLGLLYDDLGPLVGNAREALVSGTARHAGTAHEAWARGIEAAADRRGRRRRSSRARRCVRSSSGFRIERDGPLRIHRRADAPAEAIREALAAHRALVSQGQAEAGALPGARRTRVDGVRAGPPPGAAPSPFARGEGRPEEGAPAMAPLSVTEYRERNPLLGRFGRLLPTRAMAAWRRAHRELIEGRDVPAPIALVEARSGLRPSIGWLIERWEPEPASHRLE